MTRGKFTIRCRCKAYPYPHRLGGGKCNRQIAGKQGDEAFEKLPNELPQNATFNFEPGDGSITINHKEKKE